MDNNQEMHATEEDLQAIAQIEESEAGGQKMMTMTTYPNLKPRQGPRFSIRMVIGIFCSDTETGAVTPPGVMQKK